MPEYVVRIKALTRCPVRVIAQHSFAASDRRAAERMACAWAADLYGGHQENYDASAILLSQWQKGQKFALEFP